MKKPNVKDALTALDMVHATLWQLKQDAKSTSTIVNANQIECIFVLVASAMRDLGDTRIKGAK